jgi:hypothetical protein
MDAVSSSGATARIGVRRARDGEFVSAYPAGTHDRELAIEGDPTSEALASIADQVLRNDPRCRRVILPLPERDLDAIAWAESAGFRFVVDVETRSGGYSLLVIEPDWVLAQPHILEEIPLKE